MLTNEEIEQARGVIRKCIYGIPDSEGQVARDTLDRIVDELLALKTLPAMAEVDAIAEGYQCRSDDLLNAGKFERMQDLARRAIANAEAERKRADEAEVRLSGAWNLVINNEAFDSCVSTLKTLYGIAAEHAASSETKNAARDLLEVCSMAEKMRDGCVSRDALIADLTRERDELLRLLKISMDANLSYHDCESVLEGRSCLRLSKLNEQDATSILKLCGKKCQKCGDKLDGHEDESGTHCRWCVTGGEYVSGETENQAIGGTDDT